MALSDRKRRLLSMILDQMGKTKWFPQRIVFRADEALDWNDRAALDELHRGDILGTRNGVIVPMMCALAEMKGHPVADTEMERAIQLLRILQRQYRKGLQDDRSHVVDDVKKELGLGEKNDVRRLLYMMAPLGILGTWHPLDGMGVETYKLTEVVLNLRPEDLLRPAPAEAILEQETAPLEETTSAAPWREAAFDSRTFHAAIVTACRKLYVEGNLRHAILEGCLTINERVQHMTGRTEDGDSLMGLVFNEANPILTFNTRSTETQRSEQRGLMHLFKGMVAALRNPNAHELRSHADEYALECLALLSLLSRALDVAKA